MDYLCANPTCGHAQSYHDIDEDWSGCCVRGCYCKTFEYPEPHPKVKDEKPRTRPLFSSHLTEDEVRQFVKPDPREPYGKDED